ncbi:SDR family oxidoreductase [Arthrobacter crystallopoietes]|uniref:NAD(P)H dehydrogenase (Quinone) n=1 Tax=Crystallibacter crystallopoietes TaxID=37928 RepID=A0A1H0ZAR4_9MICC|nr:SDR family oxidoreductase [Arthrobacter crystallopoietes]AUI52071.1 NAD(P)-dependent oxidoreductase [Arthrobacter crystallopoietes]SDQ24545.1 NAD(P)H dehydrogenase (quinone) [Arthrobacter crystallopoietes]
MTTYAVTGATGELGALVIDALLEREIEAAAIVAVVRNTAKAAGLQERGVTVREGDYDKPETLASALAGVDTLMFISGSEVGQRVRQHGNVVEAARAAGVQRIAYTSVLRADTSDLALAPEHKATEALIRESGIPFTLLRNGWYIENYTGQLGQYLQAGAVIGAAGDARIAAATRADFAEAAAVVLTGEGHENAVYELGGTPFAMVEFASAVSEVTSRSIGYRNVTLDEYKQGLLAAGLDEGMAGFLAALEANTAAGDLDTESEDLAKLIGRPSTPLTEAVRAAHTA